MATDNYISFFDARELLALNLGMKPSNEEFWMWCFVGKKDGGIDAYYSKEYFNNETAEWNQDWRSACVMWWPEGKSLCDYADMVEDFFFLHNDIEEFQPQERYRTGNELLRRWSPIVGGEKAQKLIQKYSSECPMGQSQEDKARSPMMSNYYFGAEATWKNGLGGIYPLQDVIAVEKFLRMDESQALTVANVGAGSETIIEPKQKASSKLGNQQAAILKVIKAKQFNPMAIPDGEKGTIKLICVREYDELFKADTAFDRAWKAGIMTLWKMENHESYAHRGK
ncbi:MAG: hypothetical protein ABL919_00170 [Methylococcales bacterium]|nr:hypothetical protein [Methylococcaceae bacterium]